MDQTTVKNVSDIKTDGGKEDSEKQESIATGPEYKGSGIKTSLHGTIYQIKLLTLFLNRGIKHGYKFSLATELDEAEKFDDLVFSYEDEIKGCQVYRFLQAKHKQDETKKIKLVDLLNENDDDFSIPKYFISYRKIKQNEMFKGEFEDFIICTNIDLHDEVLKADVGTNKTVIEIDSTDDKLFDFNECSDSKQYKFQKDSKVYENLKSMLKIRHADKLAAKLAKSVASKEKTPPNDELFKCYRGWLLDKVFKIERDNNGRCIQFREDFLQTECNGDETLIYFRKALITGIEKAKLKEKVDDILNKTKFKIPETFTTDSKGSLSLDVSDEEIDDFLDKLVLAVNQPNEVELQSIIAKEIGKGINFSNGELIASRLQEKLLDWAKERKGHFLTSQDGQKLFKYLKQNLAHLGLVGVTLAHKSKIEKGYKFEDTAQVIEAIRNFKKNKEQQILIIYHKIQLLTAMKILQANTNTEVGSDIFCDSETFCNLFGTSTCPIDALQSDAYSFLVIDNIQSICDIERILKMVLRTLQHNPKKSIILSISYNEMQTVDKLLDELFEDVDFEHTKCVSVIDDENNFCNIIPESQEKLLSESKITFQGKEFDLISLLGNNSDFVAEEKYNKIKNYLKKSLLIRSKHSQSEHFCITFDSQVTESEVQSLQEIILISGDANEYKVLSERFKTKNIHWITEQVKSVYIRSHGSFHRYVAPLDGYVDENSENLQTTPNPIPTNELYLQSIRVAVVFSDNIIMELRSGYVDKFINRLKQCDLLISNKTKDCSLDARKIINIVPYSQVTKSNLESNEVIVLVSGNPSEYDIIFQHYYNKVIYYLTLILTQVWRHSRSGISTIQQKYVSKKKEVRYIDDLLNGVVLCKLISKEKIEIGKSLISENYKELKDCYVEQAFQQYAITIKHDIMDSTEEFFIVYDRELTESELEFNQEIVLISDDHSKFRELCKRHECKTIHWLVEKVEFKYEVFENYNKTLKVTIPLEFSKSDLPTRVLVVYSEDFLKQHEGTNAKFINQLKNYTNFILKSENSIDKSVNKLGEKGEEKKFTNQPIKALPSSQITEQDMESCDIVIVMDRDRELYRESDLLKRYVNKIKYALTRESTLIYCVSQGKVVNLRRYIHQIQARDYELKDLMALNSRATIIAGEPGMGKTTLLTHMAMQIQEYQNLGIVWVINIDLVRYLKEFSKLTDENTDAIKFLCNVVKPEGLKSYNGVKKEMYELVHLETNGKLYFKADENIYFKEMDLLEVKMFINMYNCGHIIVFIDGFDEISPLCKTVVSNLIRKLMFTTIKKLWVTSRPYHILQNLEIKLNTNGYSIAPLSEPQQREMFYKLLQTKSKIRMNGERIKFFIDKLLKEFAMEIDDNRSEFTSTPLHMTMIATLYEEEINNISESQNLDNWISNFVQNFSLNDLYERFIKIKLDFIYEVNKTSNLVQYYTMQEKFENILDNHRYLALLEIFTKEIILILLSNEKYNNICETFEAIMEAKEKTGLIVRVEDDRPRFVHSTFAEYFAADLLSSMLKSKHEDYSRVIEFLYIIWTRDPSRGKVLKNFLNYKLISHCDNNPHRDVLTAALYNKKYARQQTQNFSDIRDPYGRTPLHLACYNFKHDMWNFLLERSNEELSVQDKIFEWTPFHYAVTSMEHTEQLSTITNGSNEKEEYNKDLYSNRDFINAQDFKGKTPIMLALELGNEYMTGILLKFNPDLGIVDKNDYTATHYATNYACYLHLIAYGANTDEKQDKTLFSNNANKKNILLSVIAKYMNAKNSNIINYLKKQSNDFKVTLLWNMGLVASKLSHDDFCAICRLVDVNTQDSKGKTAIHHLVGTVHKDEDLRIVVSLITFLVDQGAQIDKRDNLGKTALHYVAGGGEASTVLVDFLLYSGADTRIEDNERKTPLHYALHDDARVMYLLRNGAFFDAVDANEVPEGSILRKVKQLFDSVKENNVTNIRSILNSCKLNDVLVNSRSKDSGKTPLDIAIEEKYGEIVDYLLQYGAYKLCVHHENSEDEIKLLKAVEEGNMTDLKESLQKGVSVNSIDYKSGMQPLHLAIKNGDLEVAKFLLSQDAHVNGKVANHGTILHMAIEFDLTNILLYLLNNVDSIKLSDLINTPDSSGDTPLNKAVWKNNVIAVRALFDKGAIGLIICEKGKSPVQTFLDIATRNNYTEMGETLFYKFHSLIKPLDYCHINQSTAGHTVSTTSRVTSPLDNYLNLSEIDKMKIAKDIRIVVERACLELDIDFLERCLGSSK